MGGYLDARQKHFKWKHEHRINKEGTMSLGVL